MSDAWPWKPPVGWWMRMREFGSAWRLPGGAAGEDHGAHGHGDPAADRPHVGLDELHRVVDRQARVDDAAGAVDVELDLLLGVGRLQVQELGVDEVRDLVVHRGAEEDDALVEQAGVDVERALAARVLLDDHGDQGHAVTSCSATVGLHMLAYAQPSSCRRRRVHRPSRDRAARRARARVGAADRAGRAARVARRRGRARARAGRAAARGLGRRRGARRASSRRSRTAAALRFRWDDDATGIPSRVEWTLDDAPGGTRVVVSRSARSCPLEVARRIAAALAPARARARTALARAGRARPAR